MKTPPALKLATLATAFIITASAALADAGRVFNQIVDSEDSTLVIDVPDRRFARIVNFVQESGDTRGMLAVTRNGKAAFVLTSTSATEGETQKDLIVAGPASISVAPVKNGKLFISYRLAKNNE